MYFAIAHCYYNIVLSLLLCTPTLVAMQEKCHHHYAPELMYFIVEYMQKFVIHCCMAVFVKQWQ